MRDPKRIAKVLGGVQQVWEQHPDLRLGQLLVIAARPKEPCPELFHVEDEALLQGLASYQAQLSSLRSTSDEVEVVLGAESDSSLLQRLLRVVQAAGGQMSKASFGVDGSQEVTHYDVILPAGKLAVTAETYVGLSIRGTAELVHEVSLAVRNA